MLYSLVTIMMPTTRETIIKRSYRSGQRKEIAGLVRRLEVSSISCDIPRIMVLIQI